MITYTRFRLQRQWRRQLRLFRRSWQSGSRYVRFNLFGKWRQFAMVRRFIGGWVFVVVVLAGGLLLQIRAVANRSVVLQPLPGGSYSEALVGSVKIINPILPEGSASADVSRLVFSGLTKFDTNGQLQPDLATGWQASPDGKTYTFHLRKDVQWHDGVPFTSQDVAFTLTAIQNPDTRSPLATSWQGVTLSTPDDYTVVFHLPKPYAPFVNVTNVGLLPRHLLENTEPSQLRVVEFNQHPIGTGPFKLESIDSAAGEVALKANDRYYDGKPLLESVTFRLYATATKAFEAYSHRQVQGVNRLLPDQAEAALSLGTLKIQEASMPVEVGAFFKTTAPALKDKAVRLALVQATDRQALINHQLHGEATTLFGPLFGTRTNLAGAPHQAGSNTSAANAALDAAGWKRGSGGIREKGGVRLELRLATQAGAYDGVAQELADQWAKVGVKLTITSVDAVSLQQSYIRPRNYDVLLYGINVGADPDVYAFWDSNQAKDPGLNLSVYSSKSADTALESARTVSDPNVRAAKYRSFVQTWVGDAPAVMLYTPTYNYAVDKGVHGVHVRKLIDPSDRFNNIQHWSVRVQAVRPS